MERVCQGKCLKKAAKKQQAQNNGAGPAPASGETRLAVLVDQRFSLAPANPAVVESLREKEELQSSPRGIRWRHIYMRALEVFIIEEQFGSASSGEESLVFWGFCFIHGRAIIYSFYLILYSGVKVGGCGQHTKPIIISKSIFPHHL